MNIPQVNATATDRNREQTKRIVKLLDLTYRKHEDGIHHWWTVSRFNEKDGLVILVELPNGSFTLDQVVGMLDKLDVALFAFDDEYDEEPAGWYTDKGGGKEPRLIQKASVETFDLTAAMAALIKVLEEKK